MISLSTDTQTRTLQLLEAISRELGILPQTPQEPDPVATVTFSVGTSSRDYSTITAWEADLDNGGLYSSGDTAVGELYADSDFAEAITINGGGTVGLSWVHLTAASAERHDGTASSGVRLLKGSGGHRLTASRDMEVSWIEWDGDGRTATNPLLRGVDVVHHNLVHDGAGGSHSGIVTSSSQCDCHNNIVYDMGDVGINVSGGTGSSQNILSNTSHNNGSYGIGWADDSSDAVQNNIATDNTTADFEHASPSAGTVDHNLSSDTSASGTGSLTSKTAANQFVSIVGGSEDLHLKSGADAIDAGTDLVTTPANVNIDIDGRDRDAEADTWDIGAHEYVAPAASYPLQLINERDNSLIGR